MHFLSFLFWMFLSWPLELDSWLGDAQNASQHRGVGVGLCVRCRSDVVPGIRTECYITMAGYTSPLPLPVLCFLFLISGNGTLLGLLLLCLFLQLKMIRIRKPRTQCSPGPPCGSCQDSDLGVCLSDGSYQKNLSGFEAAHGLEQTVSLSLELLIISLEDPLPATVSGFSRHAVTIGTGCWGDFFSYVCRNLAAFAFLVLVSRMELYRRRREAGFVAEKLLDLSGDIMEMQWVWVAKPLCEIPGDGRFSWKSSLLIGKLGSPTLL